MKKLLIIMLISLSTNLFASQFGSIISAPGQATSNSEEKEVKKYSELIPYLENSNNGEMYFYLASIYLNGSPEKDTEGKTVEKNPEKAIEWFEKAVNKKFPYAAITLGSLYIYHEDFISKENNIELAEKYLNIAIESEVYEAYTPLADIYFNYKGDAKLATEYLFKGAEKFVATAQYGLAVIYNVGLKSENFSIEKNSIISAKYLTDACMNQKKTERIKKICFDPNIITKEKK